MNLLIWVLRVVDSVMDIFQQLAGTKSIDNEGNDLISLFLNNGIIQKVFFGILIISVVVAAVSIIVAIVKAFVNMSGGERKPISKITGQGISTVFISLLMAGIMISGITIANSLLRDVNAAFGINDESNVCNDLFDIAVDDYAYESVPNYVYEDEKDEFGNFVYETDENGIPKVDDNNKLIKKQKIVYMTDADGNVLKDDSGNPVPQVNGYTRVPIYQKDQDGNIILDANNNPIPVGSGWTEYGIKQKGIPGWSILDEDADSIMGDYSKPWPYIIPDHNKQNGGLIYWGSFNFILGYVTAVIVLIAVISACLGLVKRLYDLVILFLSLPLIASTIPLDDGARFKVWRETVISKVILAYGAVFAVNTFIIMAPIISTLHVTKIIKMVLLVGGGLSINGGMLLFARIFGTDAAESREMAQSARTLLAGTVAGSKGINAARKWAFGVNDDKNAEKRRLGAFRRFGQFLGLGNSSRANARLGLTGSSGTISGAGGSSAALTTQSQAGSQLGQALKTAGTQRYRDALTGRFISNAEAAKRGMTGSTGAKI
ncbi:MAG: hypothetical protein NC133_04015 [Prevotella sp.]|nr:hypothetical protein [Prevotella sp.]